MTPQAPGFLFEPLEPRLLLSADLNPLQNTALTSGTVLSPAPISADSVTPLLSMDAGSTSSLDAAVPVTAQASGVNATSPISGTIATPGQSVQYSFALSNPTNLYFDSLTNDPQINWSLSGPSGSIVSQRSFQSSDANSVYGSDSYQASPGTYTLTVSGNNSYTGSYSFRLLDLSTAPTIQLNTPVNDTLSPGNSTNAYQFSGTAGQRIYVQPQGGGDYVYRVLDPNGNLVGASSTNSNSGQGVTLAGSGAYTLLVEGDQSAASAPINFAITVYADADTMQALTLGQTVTNAISQPGQLNTYTFSVTSETTAVFDSLTNNGNLTYTLKGPPGTLANQVPFSGADAQSTSSNTLLDLVPGSYTLIVSGQSGLTTPYAFRVLDLATATPIAYGNAITGTIGDAGASGSAAAPGTQTNLYRFTGAVGDKITLDDTQSTGAIGLRVFDPFGKQIVQQGYSTTSPITLTVAGTYTVLIEGYIGNSGPATYGFSISNSGPVAVPALTGTALTLGQTATHTVATAGETDDYVFTITGPTRINFDPLSTPYTTTLNASWQLDGPQGSVVTPQSFYSNDTVLLQAPGTYRLRVVDPNAGETYSFAVQNVAAGTPVSYDATVSGTLNPGTATAVYNFSGTAGDQIYFNDLSSTGSVQWRVIDQYGANVFNQGYGSVGPLTLPTTGTYSLLIGGTYYNTSPLTYSFQIDQVVNTTAALTLGTTVTGTLAQPAQQASYTFTLTAATELYFNGISPQNSTFTWALTGPGGVVVSGTGFYTSNDRTIAAGPGTYTLTISAGSGSTGVFSFRLSDVAAATPVSYGQVVSATTSAPVAATLYSFTGSAGDAVYFNTLSNTDPYLQWKVIDPFGNTFLGSGFSAFGRRTLPSSGRYTIVVSTAYYDPSSTASYSFQLSKESDTTTALASIDGPAVVGPLSVAGQGAAALAFTGAEAVQVASPQVDLRSQVSVAFWINPATFNTTWEALVYKGDFSTIGGRTYSVLLNSSGYIYLASADVGGVQSVQTASGSIVANQWTYVTAVIDRVSGGLSIYLNGQLAASAGLRTGQAVESAGPLQIAGSAETNNLGADGYVGALQDLAIYGSALTASQAAALYASPASVPSANLALFLPMSEASGAATLADTGPNHLTATVSSTNAGLAGTITGTFSVPGQIQTYTFTLTQAANLVFDGLTNNSNITVTLTGPGGLSVARNLRNGDSYEFGSANPLIAAAAGNYTISVTDSSTSPDTYAFRYIDLAGALPITLQTPVSGSLSDGVATAAYSFQGSAGEMIYLHALALTNGVGSVYASIRLIDPNGNQVFGPVNFSDIASTTLAYSGTYTLLVEGRSFNPVPTNFSFVIYPLVNQTVPLTLGTNPAPGPTWTAGQFGSAVQFNGQSVVSVPDAPSLDLTDNVSMQAWIKPSNLPSTWYAIFYKGAGTQSDSSLRDYGLWLNANGSILLTTSDANGPEYIQTAAGVVTPGQWTQVSAVIDRVNGAMHIYINGVDVMDGSLRAGFAQGSSNPLLIGGTQEVNGQFSDYQGAIDEARVWSVALTASQVAATWNTALTGPQTGLALALSFNEGSGLVAHDNSGNGNNASLVTLDPKSVSGTITVPGQSVTYTFTLAQAQTLYFDSQIDDPSFSWTLTGPQGTVVSARSFTSSDSDRGNPILNTLPAGAYQLTVLASGPTTGNFAFRLLQQSDAVALTPGTIVPVTLQTGNAAQLFTFNGTAGERVYFDQTAYNSTTAVYVHVYDPLGNDLYGAIYAGNLPSFGVQKLALTGQYTVVIDGDVYYDPNFATLSFAVQVVTDKTAALTPGTAVAGSIDTPGQTANYTFSLSSPTLAVFDALSTGNTNWSLMGPTGMVVSSQSFGNADSYNQSNDGNLLAAGNYTLAVRNSNDTVGSFSFNLLTAAQATALPANTPIAISIPATATKLYSFSGTAGQRVEFDAAGVTGSVAWRLLDSNGNELFGPQSLGVAGPVTLMSTGTYLLAIEGQNSNTTAITGTIQALALPVPSVNGAVSVFVPAASATPVDLGYFAAGTYTLAATGFASLAGGISDTSSLTFNPDGTAAFTFQRGGFGYLNNGPASFDQPDNSYGLGGASIPLGALMGSLVAQTGSYFLIGHNDTVTLTQAGHIYAQINDIPNAYGDNSNGYQLTVTPQSGATGAAVQSFDGGGTPYALSTDQNLPGATVVSTADPHGQVLQLTSASSSYQNNRVDFPATATAGPFATVQTDFDFRMISGSNGGGEGIGAVLLNTAYWGNAGPSTGFGNPALVPQGLGAFLSTPDNSVVLTWNGSTIVTVAAGFNLLGNEWDHATITVSATDGGSLVSVALSEAGGAATTVISKQFIGGLFLDGNRLAVYGLTDYRTATQQIDNVTVATTPATAAVSPLVLGSTVSGNIATAGAVARYQFTLTQATTALFDSLTYNSNLTWTLTGPNGTVVAGRNFDGSDSIDLGSSPALRLLAGTYTLSVSASYGTTGAFNFKLDDLAAATPLTFTAGAAAVSSSLDPANETLAYSFTATAGQAFYISNVSGWNGSQYLQVLDPAGNQVISSVGLYTDAAFTAVTAGRYTLLIEGRYYAGTGSVAVGLTLNQVTNITGTINTNTVVSGSFTQPGQTATYTVVVPSATALLFDQQNTDGDIRMTLTGPGGNQIFAVSNNNSDQGPYLVPAGTYTVTITHQNADDHLGSYQFQLIDSSAASALTLGTPVSGTLATGNAAAACSFQGTAGQSLYFDAVSSTGGSLNWVLIDPAGNQVFSTNFATQAAQVLSATGTYRLYIEGYLYNTAPLSYNFNVLAPATTNAALTLGQQVNGSIPTAGATSAYTFTLTSATSVVLAALSDTVGGGQAYNSTLGWTLTGPSGPVVSRSFNFSDGTYFGSGSPALQLAAGSYTLRFAANSDATGAYSFRLLDLAAATPLTLGSPVAGALSPGSDTTAFSFTGAAGDKIYVAENSYSGGNLVWRLIDPNNNQVFYTNFGSSPGQITLPVAGNYKLLLEGFIGDGGQAANYNFTLYPLSNQQPIPVTTNPTAQAPDLQVTGLSVTASGGGAITSGSTLAVTWADANTGSAPTDASWTDSVVVTNTTTGQIISTGLYPFNAATNGALAPAASYARSASFQLPAGSSGVGSIQVTVTTDSGNTVTESNAGGTAFSNNTASTTVTSTLAAYPDLQVSNVALMPSPGYAAGQIVTVSWTLANAGNAAVTVPFTESVRVRNLSTGNVITLQSDTVSPPLAAGSSAARSLTFVWPTGMDGTGQFEADVTADSTGQVVEAVPAGQRTDNTASTTLISAPDLLVQANSLKVTNTNALQSGDAVTISWVDQNQGDASAATTWNDQVAIYNTTTGQYVTVQPVDAGGPLAAGATRLRSFSFVLPDGAAGVGSLQIAVTVDPARTVIEAVSGNTDPYANNTLQITAASVLRSYPDLVTTASAPSTGVGGAGVTVAWTVKNSGAGATAAGSWNDVVILSPTATLGTTGNIVLGQFGHNGDLASGAAYSNSQTLTLPATARGPYYIFVVSDSGQVVTEPTGRADATSAALPIAINSSAAALNVSGVTAPASVSSGGTATVSWTVTNSGSGPTNVTSWTDRVYLSQSTTAPQAGDPVLGTFAHLGTLAIGGSYTGSLLVTFPGNLFGTGYHLLVVTDADDQVFRAGQTTGNVGASSALALLSPDLQVSGVTAPAAVQPGQPVTVAWTVTDNGTGSAAGSWTDRVYYAPTGNLTDTATFPVYDIAHGGGLAAGSAYAQSVTFTMPTVPDATGGRFFVVTDLYRQIAEANGETDNSAASPAVTVTHPDLAVSAVTAPASGISSQSVAVSWTVTNTGSAPIAAGSSWTDQVYVATGTSLDGTQSYLGSVTEAGPLAVGASYTGTLNVTLPAGLVPGSYHLLALTNAGNSLNEAGNTTNNVASSAAVSVSQPPLPDLQISGLAAGPLSGGTLTSSETVTYSWKALNVGAGPVASSFYSHVKIVDTSTGVTLVDQNVYYDVGANGPIAGNGGAAAQQLTFTLPNGAAGIGSIVATVTADAFGQVFEGGDARTDNTATLTTNSVLQAYPDLTVDGLSVGPGSPHSGDTLTIGWTTSNHGSAPVSTAFRDEVIVINQSTGAVLSDQMVAYDPSVSGAIAGGSGVLRSATVTLPAGAAGVGTILVKVIADAGNAVVEAVVPHTDNSATVQTVSTLNLYPDLQVSAITAPTSPAAGSTVTLTYTVTNVGTGTASGSWADQIYLSPDGLLSDALAVTSQSETSQSIAAGASVQRTATFQLPAMLDGTQYVVVTTDKLNSLVQLNNVSHTATAASPTQITPGLTLSFTQSTVANNAGAIALSGVVTRSGNATSALAVTILADQQGLLLPTQVVIAAGQLAASFQVGAVNSGLTGSALNINVTASAAGYSSGTSQLQETNSNTPALTLVAPATVNRSDGTMALTLTRNTPTDQALAVTLTSDLSTLVSPPSTVTFQAGQSSITVNVALLDDGLVYGNRNVHINAIATGLTPAVQTVAVVDTDVPTLTVTLGQSTISEASGANATTLTITRSVVTSAALNVALGTMPSMVALTSRATIAAGQSSVTIQIGVYDQNLPTSTVSTVPIIATVGDPTTGVPIPGTQAQTSLTITGSVGPSLGISLAATTVVGGSSVTAALTRAAGDSTQPLTVTLASSNTGEATVPATVTFAANQTTVTFTIASVNDGSLNSLTPVQISAVASGYATAYQGLTVSNQNLPNLTVSGITNVASIVSGQSGTMSYTVTNTGKNAATGPFTDSIYLSNRPLVNGDSVLLGSRTTQSLAAGQSYTNSVGFSTSTPGTYYFIVVSDSGQVVQVISTADEMRTGATPLTVTPAYTVTVGVANPAGKVAPEGTVIALSGTATDAVSGQPAPFKLVTIYVTNNGFQRTLQAVTDPFGNFTINFHPVGTESGTYQVSASQPGAATPAAQDTFTLIGLTASASTITIAGLPNQTVQGSFTITDTSNVPLTGLMAALSASLPATATLTISPIANIGANGTVTVNYTFTSTVAITGGATLNITSDQGAKISVALNVSVLPLTPNLVANPGYLNAGMVVGTQSQVSFTVTNTGGAASGDLTVELPAGIPWLSLQSLTTIPSIAAGGTATVTLQLTPDQSLALQEYQGALVLVSSTTSLTVPFTFRAVSTATGTVSVTAQDEAAYFAVGAPNLAGATVTLQDAYTNAVVATGITDASGNVSFGAIAAGGYLMILTAPSHATVTTSITVVPGITNSFTEFLHYQAVSYTWAVVPTQAADHYQITLTSTFQTAVPMPIVTVDQPLVLPLVLPGQITTINLTYTNHGLIDATQLSFNVPSDPDFIITPLISSLAVLPAGASITVPFQIQFNPNSTILHAMQAGLATQGAMDASQAANGISPLGAAGYGAAIAKCLGIDAVYTYVCQDNQWVQVKTTMDTIGCADNIYGAATGTIESGNLLGAPCAVLDAVIACLTANRNLGTFADCTQAIVVSLCYGLTEGPAGVIGAGSDILSCLCDLAGLFGGGDGSITVSDGEGGFGGGGYGGSAGTPWQIPVGYETTTVGCGPTASSVSTLDGSVATTAMPMTSADGVCAQVVVQLSQQAVITRTNFVGTLDIMNGMGGVDLTNLSVSLSITDVNGNSANDMFDTNSPSASGFTGALGSFTLTGGGNGSLVYTFIPTVSAALTGPMTYYIGGIMHYVQGGETFDIQLSQAKIIVYPEAQLQLSYFWQRNVIGDDPFTPQVEPSEPFYLGLRATNVGAGTAADLTITSSQPKIIENEKGLLVDFKITGSQVQNQAGTGSLTVDLGTIAPGQTTTADWQLLSTLQGRFTNFSASFEHEDDNGSLRTSLIQSVTIAPLIEVVHVGDNGNTMQPSDHGVPSFLVENTVSYTPDGDAIPDMLYIGDQSGSQQVTDVPTGSWTAGAGDTETLSFAATTGWDYIAIADPDPGDKLVKIVRSDGTVMTPGDTVWRTDRVFPPTIPGALDIDLVHLLDFNSTGSYTFYFVNDDGKPPHITAVQDLSAAVLTAAVPSVDVTFSKTLDPASLTTAALTLQQNGVTVALNGVTVADVGAAAGGGEIYRISGLAALTNTAGNYTLTVDGTKVKDTAQDAGDNAVSTNFLISFGQTLMTALSPVSPAVRATPADTVTVTFSSAVSVFNAGALSLTQNGQAVTLGTLVTVVQLSSTQWQVSGLSNYEIGDGSYVLTAKGGLITDASSQPVVGVLSTSWTVNTMAPAVTLDTISPNPRNTIVPSLIVTLNEAIDPASFDYHAISVTQNGGPNLVTSAVTVTKIDATHYSITNFNNSFSAATGINGTYAITVDATKLRSVAGVAGVAAGSASESWVLNVTGPAAATNIHITPDNGASPSDGITNTLSLSVLGTVADPSYSVRFTDLTTNTELGYGKVGADGTFTGAIALSGPGTHQIRVRVIDTAGNTSDATYSLFIDTTAPTISAIVAPASPTMAPVAEVDLTLSKGIIDSSFTGSAVSLTLNGTAVAVSGLSLMDMGSNMWSIAGLSAFDDAAGTYVLTVSATGLEDMAGNMGTGSMQVSWIETTTVVRTGFGGTVYNDLNGNGVKSAGETGLAGWTIFLDSGMTGVYAAGDPTATTDSNGAYSFAPLAAGMYTVVVMPMAGFVGTGPAEYMVTVTAGQYATTSFDFGEFQPGRISGTLFDDSNASGTQGTGETGLAGVTIYLDGGDGTFHAGDLTTTTAADGSFSFTGLAYGSYKVGQTAPTGYRQTTTTPSLTVSSGTNASGLLIGDVKLASVSGTVFNDVNGNGLQDAGDAGLSGWTVFIDAQHDGQLDAGDPTAVTDASGHFNFTGLLPGSYSIGEVLKPGYSETSPLTPAASGGSVSIGVSDVPIVLESSSTTNTSLGAQSLADAAGLTGLTTALQDPRFAGLTGSGETTVVIDTGLNDDPAWFAAGTVAYEYNFANNSTDVTDTLGHGSDVASIIASDNASDPGVAPGARLIILKVFNDQGQGFFSYVSQALTWVAANVQTYNIGVVNMSLGDGGNWTTAASRYGLGTVLSQIAAENVITVAAAGNSYHANQTIGLAYPGSDPSVLAVGSIWPGNLGGPWLYTDGTATTTTAADQIAAYSQRDPNLPFELAPGAVFSGPTSTGGTESEQGTSQASVYVAAAATLAQQLAQRVLGHNLSLTQFESLLVSSSDTVTDSPNAANNVTASGATYNRLDFVKLFNGIEALAGTPATTPTPTPSTVTAGSGNTPITAVASGFSTVTLTEGQNLTGVGFGNFQAGSISGTVFADGNKNGSIDTGETGVSGVTVFIDAAGTGTLVASDPTTTTDASGMYSFVGLTAGTYTVRVVLPSGEIATTTAVPVTMTSGLAATVNVGLSAVPTSPTLATVSGTVFRDLDKDGVQAATEPGIASRTVFIDAAGTGALAAGDPQTTTDANGHYSFANLTPGSYTIDEVLTPDVTATSPSAVAFTVASGGAATVNYGLRYNGPTLSATGAATVQAGSTYTLSLAATDPLHTVAEWFVDWGDGTLQGFAGSPSQVTHTYAATGTASTGYTIQAAAQDDTGTYNAASLQVAVAPPLEVTGVIWNADGVAIRFNQAMNAAAVEIYDAISGSHTTLLAPDLTLTGAATGAVSGSIVFDPDMMGLTFIKTGSPLAADTYTLQLLSGANGFQSGIAGAGSLDGGTVGLPGSGAFATTNTVPAIAGPVLSLPDFMVGPGQAAIYAVGGAGIPVTISGAAGLNSLTFHASYDQTALTITGATGAGFTLVSASGGVATFQYSGPAVAGGAVVLGQILGTVPLSAPYGQREVIKLSVDAVSGGGLTASAITPDNALHVVGFLGDADGSATYTSDDGSLIQRVIVKLDGGFAAWADVDPVIVADVARAGVLATIDATRVSQVAAGRVRPEIQALPTQAVTVDPQVERIGLRPVAAAMAASETPILYVSDPAIDDTLAGLFPDFSLTGTAAADAPWKKDFVIRLGSPASVAKLTA